MEDQNQKSWKCAVCGYIHYGDAPPSVCPICGVGPEEFLLQKEEKKVKEDLFSAMWRCPNCGNDDLHDPLPEVCPVCGRPSERFERKISEKKVIESTNKSSVVIVGAGIAGVSAAEAIRNACPSSEITLISKEKELPYYRLNLTRFLAGDISDDSLPIHPAQWYKDNNIDLQLDSEVGNLGLEDKRLSLRSGKNQAYDKLVLTTGSHPFMPPFPGSNREGVVTLRTIEDAQKILSSIHSGDECICIGGGLLGLETAVALRHRGAKVTLLEGHEWLMPRQLNKRAGEVLKRQIDSRGISLLTMAKTDEIFGDERVAGVRLQSGEEIKGGLVIVTVGVRPNSYLARMAGLEVNKGVVVDHFLQTSKPNVFSGGDVAEHNGTLYGVWAASQFQGKIAGMNSIETKTHFGDIPRANTLKVLGLDLVSIGIIEPEDGSYLVIETEREEKEYFRFIFHDNLLVGSILFGKTPAAPKVKKAIEEKMDCSSLLMKKPGAGDLLQIFESSMN